MMLSFVKIIITCFLWERVQIIVVFEGEATRGDRHCHFLVYVPNPRKMVLSRDTLIDRLPLSIKVLWHDLSETPWSGPSDWSDFRLKFRYPAWFWNKLPSFYKKHPKGGFEWHEKESEIPLDIGRCREEGPRYSLKYVGNYEVDWSDWHFITPPKYTKFENQNLIVCSNRNKQKRRSLGLL